MVGQFIAGCALMIPNIYGLISLSIAEMMLLGIPAVYGGAYLGLMISSVLEAKDGAVTPTE